MNHLYYTWCRAEHSLSGNSGWGIRALSPDFPEYEANQLIPHVSNFQFLDTISPENSPVRLAYVNHPELGHILIHAVAIGQCPGQSRGGNYFVHCLTHLDENFDGFQAICHWNSPSWVVEDFDSPSGSPSWNVLNIDFDSTEEIRKNLRDPEYYDTAMYCLEAFLALESDETKKLYIAGPSEDIAQLISVVGISLSRERRKGMTFSTYDNLNSPPDVKIMGCFFADSNTEDFPPYHYQDGFYSVNTCFNKRSVATPPESKFARGILSLLRDYGDKQVQNIHDFIELIGRDEPRDHEIIFALYPQPGTPIQLDPNSVLYVMRHWPIDFLDRLPEPRREEFLKLIRNNCHPDQDGNSRDWILKNLVYLKALSQKSPYMQALLEDLFEDNDLKASLSYVNYYPSYIDENVPVQSRSRAIDGLGQFINSKNIPSIDEPQVLENLSKHCHVLADNINEIPFDNGNSVPVQLWFRLSLMCKNHVDLEKIYGLFGNLTGGNKQDFLEQILSSYPYFPEDHLNGKIVTFLEYLNTNKLTIPPDTLGKFVVENDELFFDVFNRLNQDPTYLAQLFTNPNALSYFREFSGPNKSVRFRKIVEKNQITQDNFLHIRHMTKDKEVDEYLLYSHPPNSIYQSLYQEEVSGFRLDDLLDKNKHDLCRRLESEGYISKKTHPIIAYLDVYALAQKENNWLMVRNEPDMLSLINIYHSNRGKPGTELFLRLYTEYIYTGINDFTDLENYLRRDPVSLEKEDQDQNRDTKLALLGWLIELTNNKLTDDRRKKDVIAAIFFHTAILLPDGKAAVPREGSRQVMMTPLIDYNWIWYEKVKPIPDDTPGRVKNFVGVSLKKFVLLHYNRVLNKDLKKQMLAAFKERSVSQNEVCFGDTAPGPKPLWQRWWVWVLLLLFGIMVGWALNLAISIISGTDNNATDNNATDNNTLQNQNEIIKSAIRKRIKKPKGPLTKADLAKIKKLEFLNLTNSGLTDVGLKEVAKLQQFTRLGLAGTHITDPGLKELGKMKQLKELQLSRTKITDEGLKHLAGLKQLEKLHLAGTKVTKPGEQKLKKDIGNKLKVYR